MIAAESEGNRARFQKNLAIVAIPRALRALRVIMQRRPRRGCFALSFIKACAHDVFIARNVREKFSEAPLRTFGKIRDLDRYRASSYSHLVFALAIRETDLDGSGDQSTLDTALCGKNKSKAG